MQYTDGRNVQTLQLLRHLTLMVQLKLVQIDRLGNPSEPIGPLPQVVRHVCQSTSALYSATGTFIPPWTGYIALFEGNIFGTCAFKSPPSDGKVEIAYFTFPGYEGRGLATAMAYNLIAIARKSQPGIIIMAQTLPERNASNAILKKLGFKLVGTAMDHEAGEVWEWHLT
jgi:[ribosomal protein S5]-alanine N-acetyltransferase